MSNSEPVSLSATPTPNRDRHATLVADRKPRPFRMKRKPNVEAMQHDGSVEINRAIIDWTRGSRNPAFMDKDIYDKPFLYLTDEGAVLKGWWVVRYASGFIRMNDGDFRNIYEAA